MQNKKPNNQIDNERKKIITKDYLIGLILTFIVDCGLVGLMILIETTSLNMSFSEDAYVILSDAFCVSGGFTLLIFVLTFISGEGAFDAIIYGVKVAFYTTFYRNIRETKIPSTYGEYRNLKREKARKGISYLWQVGLFFLLIGIIFLIPFNKSI